MGNLGYHVYGVSGDIIGADYLYLDKKGSVKGRATDDGDTVRFYDKSNNPKGWYDRDTNTTFDKNNRPTRFKFMILIGINGDFYLKDSY